MSKTDHNRNMVGKALVKDEDKIGKPLYAIYKGEWKANK